MPDNQRFTVCALFWERVFLNLEIKAECEQEPTFFFERVDRLTESNDNIEDAIIVESIPLKIDGVTQDGTYKICVNTPAANGRQFLNNGTWIIVAYCANNRYICSVSKEVAYSLEDKSRVFPYCALQYSYCVSFRVREKGENDICFVINSFFMKVNDRWKKRHFIEEAKTLKGKIKGFFLYGFIFLLKLIYGVMYALFPKNGRRILLMSESKSKIGGNLKAVDDELKRLGLDKKYRISYSFREYDAVKINIFRHFSLIAKIARQDYIFIDDYAHIFGLFNLGEKTKLIQIWHAGEGFKAVGFCRFGKDGSPFPTEVCHKKYDYAVSASKSLVRVFAEVFGIEEEAFIPAGMPRLDGFLDEDRIEGFKSGFYEEYPSLRGKRIILFAPTYRGKNQKTAYYDYSLLDLQRIYDACSTDTVFLIKMHPFIKEKPQIPDEYGERIIDFSFFNDINSLYYVTDLLITDYSSNYYEYLLLKKPCIFFTPDRELYELTRGVHRSIRDSAPGKVCDTFDEMISSIENSDFETEKSLKFVEDNFGEYDGHSSKKLLEKVLGEEI